MNDDEGIDSTPFALQEDSAGLRRGMSIDQLVGHLMEAGFVGVTYREAATPNSAYLWLRDSLAIDDPDAEEEAEEATRHWKYYYVASNQGGFGVFLGHDAMLHLESVRITATEYQPETPTPNATFVPIGGPAELRRLVELVVARHDPDAEADTVPYRR